MKTLVEENARLKMMEARMEELLEENARIKMMEAQAVIKLMVVEMRK